MSYHERFNPGKLFFELCHPHLSHLPGIVSDPPLEIAYPRHLTNSIRFQWYNYFHHTSSNYKIKVVHHPDRPDIVIFIISLKAHLTGAGTVLKSKLTPRDDHTPYTEEEIKRALDSDPSKPVPQRDPFADLSLGGDYSGSDNPALRKDKDAKRKHSPGKWKPLKKDTEGN